MRLQLHRFEFDICIILCLLRSCCAFQPLCNAAIYGIPNYRDCLNAWHFMPYAQQPGAIPEAKSPELFSEPQYLLPPFTAIRNRYRPLPIVQVPKIWRYNGCRLALLSYGRNGQSVKTALFTSNWKEVLVQMQALLACGQTSPSGGFVPLINLRNGELSAALYMYSPHSPFESAVNYHMSSGLPVTPPVSVDQLDVIGNFSLRALTNGTQDIRYMPVDLSLLRDITLLD
ncbi:hypothetical protein BDR22DRAFT_187844 [Usnea florida]